MSPATPPRRLLPASGSVPVLLEEHNGQHGPLPVLRFARRGALAAELRAAGLRTRDGWGLPVDLGPARPGQRLVASAARVKDRALVWLVPNLVLDGIQLVCASAGFGRAQFRLAADRGGRLRGLLESELSRRDDVIPVTPAGPDTGGINLRSLDAETLADVALIARYGPNWFRSAGTELREVRLPGGRIDVVEILPGVRIGPA